MLATVLVHYPPSPVPFAAGFVLFVILMYLSKRQQGKL